MTTTELFALIADAHALHRATKDPLLPSALQLMTEAAAGAMVHDDEQVVCSPQQALAVGMVQKLRDAYFVLYGFSPLTTREISYKSTHHERRDPDPDHPG